ncbi:putative baseplate assembly protein [Sorangium sp. So ce1389]|uniref:putative baseplate assembly protein n=1 Tax=Sorangium sp. So ce1389 TaxID=3133336 RepID=UPI003F5FE74D
MPIRPPVLDDRTYDDLLSDLLARIPAHTPEWTNVRLGDPGRTLLELFAWLGDALLYRVNLIPEKQRLAFLRLLGLEPRPALPARGVVSLAFDDDRVQEPVRLPAGVVLQGPVPFETRKLTWVYPVTSEAYIKRPIRDDERKALGSVLDGLPILYGLQEEPVFYVTTPVFVGGASVASGVDLSEGTVDGCLWIALFAPDDRKVAEPVAESRAAFGPTPDGVHRRVTVGIAPALALEDPLDVAGAVSSLPEGARIRVAWEVTTGASGDGAFVPLDASDGTDGMTRTGVVELTLPDKIGAPTTDVRKNLLAGVGDTPPRLDDEKKASRLVAWLRMRLLSADGGPRPQLALSWAGFGAVEIDQRRTTFGRQIGESTGLADQVLALGGTSVEPETLVVEVAEQGRGFEAWARVPDIALATRGETVYALSAEEGTIRFGDGVRGKIPPEGARIRVARMRAGGGERGNLPPLSLKEARVPGVKLRVVQGLPTSGGREAESLDEAEKRIPSVLRHRERAVTEDDFRALAAAAPGARVGRVEVLPKFAPKRRVSGVPGVVTVMVLPEKAMQMPPAPRADRVFLERVFAYLDPRRPLATELYVIGCEYVPLSVSVAVVIRPGLERDDVLTAVRDALREYLWPLAPGGPARRGWPLGGTVRARELEVVVSRMEGVEGVATPRLFRKAGEGWTAIEPADACDPAEAPLEKWQLPELLHVVVVEGTESPLSIISGPSGGPGGPGGTSGGPGGTGGTGGTGGGGAGGTGGGGGRPTVAVPVVPEVC